MHKVIVDTNVFISGIVFGGIPREIISPKEFLDLLL